MFAESDMNAESGAAWRQRASGEVSAPGRGAMMSSPSIGASPRKARASSTRAAIGCIRRQSVLAGEAPPSP